MSERRQFTTESDSAIFAMKSNTMRRCVLCMLLACGSLPLAGCGKGNLGSESNTNDDSRHHQVAQQTADAEPAKRAEAMQSLAEIGDNESIDSLIGGLRDESELVRRAAHDAIVSVLKRKISFDPAAPPDKRARQLASIEKMWQNLVERELVEDVKERWPLEYYYDLNSGELFEDRAGLGPVEMKSGPSDGMPAGVLAVVFACNDCGDEEDRYVAWIEVPLSKLVEYNIPFDKIGVGRLDADDKSAATMVRAPDGGDWVLAGSAAATAITESAQKCVEREVALLCRPGR